MAEKEIVSYGVSLKSNVRPADVVLFSRSSSLICVCVRYGLSTVVSGNGAPLVAGVTPRHWSAMTSFGTYWVAPLAENVKPKRLFTGTTALTWKPAVILR